MKIILGDIKNGRELGYKGSSAYIWAFCYDCLRERWVILYRGKPQSLRCRSCSAKRRPRGRGEACHNWKGGRVRLAGGYFRIKLIPSDPFYPMASRTSYVLEHRLVMAKFLGRCLKPWEIVHHKNHIRDDNHIENLQLVKDVKHSQITIIETKIARLENKIEEQGRLIRLLQFQNRSMRLEALE